MTRTSNKLLALVAGIAMSIPVSGSTFAATSSIPAQANFLVAITLGAPTTMDFANVEFTAIPTGVGDTVALGTDSSRTFSGVFGGSGAAGIAGGVTITAGSISPNMSISCSTTGMLSDGTITIGLKNVEYVLGIAGVVSGGGTACLGLGVQSSTYTYVAAPTGFQNKFLIGATIDGTAGVHVTFPAGLYTTALAGGTPITVQVTYI